MQDFVNFSSSILTDVSSFLMTEPIKWFVGLFLLYGVARLCKYIIS